MDIDRAAALRAMRAYLDLDQNDVALAAGIGGRTLIEAERGRDCSDKTWTKICGYYAVRGLHWREGDGGELGRLLVLTIEA